MTCRFPKSQRNGAAALATALLLLSGGCVPVEQEQLVEFFRDLLLSALAAFLL